MLIRIINGKKSADYECAYIVKTEDPDFFEMELCGGAETAPRTLRLPDDGQAIYQMNNAGENIQVYRWPRR